MNDTTDALKALNALFNELFRKPHPMMHKLETQEKEPKG